MEYVTRRAEHLSDRPSVEGELTVVECAGAEPAGSQMAVSIAGVSTACSKVALASSARAVRQTLSNG